ncbi:hypothetical protein BG003_004220 [Podila horticola]|nr:hypothetical protein BG003_004220 [Podila horticola]
MTAISDKQLLSATLPAHIRTVSVRSSRAEVSNTTKDGLVIQRAHKPDSSLARNTKDGPKERALPPVLISSAKNSSAYSPGSSPVMFHASEVQVLQFAEPMPHVDTAKSTDQTTPMFEGAEISRRSSSSPPMSTTFSSISSMSHFGDCNMSDSSASSASTPSDSTPAAPYTAHTPHRSNHVSHPPTAARGTLLTRHKSPPLLPPWTKSSTPMSTPEAISGMVSPATVLQRLFNNPLYSDLALTVNEVTFHVHRGIVAEQCSYFRRLFEDARSSDPTTEIKKIDCSYKHVFHEHSPKERDLVETLGEEEGEVETPIDTTQKPQNPTRTASLRTGKFRSDNPMNNDEKQFDTDAEDEAQGRPAAKATAARPESHVPKTTQPSPPKANDTPPESSSPHHPQHLREDLHLESFLDLRINTKRAILAAGYTAQHFALFLQILYGIQTATTLKDTDLLPVLHIAHVYELGWLVSLLGAQIFQRLTLSAETWVPILQFAERYRLDTIRQLTIEYASLHRALWTLAVETLSLEDFKVFLRGIHEKDAAASGGSGGVKDELLMMFLLVHYQDTTSFSATAQASFNTGASSATANMQPKQQVALLRRLSRSRSCRQRAANGSSSVLKIRQQLHDAKAGSALHSETLTIHESDRLEQTHVTHQGRQSDDIEQSSVHKAEKAKLWMRRFKMECGWEGKISTLN